MTYSLSHLSLAFFPLHRTQNPSQSHGPFGTVMLSHHYSDADNNSSEISADATGVGLTCSASAGLAWHVGPQVTEKLSCSNKSLQAFSAEAYQSCYLMADVLFVTQPLQDGYEDHRRRHLRSLTHHVGLHI